MDFTIEDLRIMIGQNLSLEFLVPVAIGHLEVDPLSEGDFYPGDLLKAVLSIDPAFWKKHADLWRRASPVAGRALTLAEEHEDVELVKKQLSESIREFQSSGI
jgi:hypothetical protein